MGNGSTFNVYLDDETTAFLKLVAKAEDRTPTAICKRFVLQALRRRGMRDDWSRLDAARNGHTMSPDPYYGAAGIDFDPAKPPIDLIHERDKTAPELPGKPVTEDLL